MSKRSFRSTRALSPVAPSPTAVEKLSSMKLVPGAKRLGTIALGLRATAAPVAAQVGRGPQFLIPREVAGCHTAVTR